ncbi:MAG TPA: thioredoxin domain-containing protein [bacterium]|nr:thioredoxin domain-containing protein [bacterium]HPT29762.1 thioredoxin domain-containing protein [bacterium]
MKQKSFYFAAVLLLAVVVLSGCDSNLGSWIKNKKLSPETAKAKVEQFVNDNLMAEGSKATIESITEENGLYKLAINIGQGQIIDSYLTKDGSKFFPQALDIKEIEGAANTSDTSSTPVTTVTEKKAKPEVELFVMSYCPYGTQIEKGILPVVDLLKDKIDFELKFCDYAMHGDKELTENMVQYCIQKEQTAKLSSYLSCFLADGQSDACLTKAGVDKTKVNSCVSKTDKQFGVMAQKEKKGSYPAFNVNAEDNAKYNVGGSPTLIINGQEIQSDRDPQSLLNTICSAFENKPKECDQKLSTASPAAGFGSGTDTSGANGGCN